MEQVFEYAQLQAKNTNTALDKRLAQESKEVAALPDLLKALGVLGEHTQKEMNRRNNQVNNSKQLSA